MPEWKRVVKTRLASLRLDGASEECLAEELAQHLDDHHQELCQGGMAPDEADRLTLAELDDLYPLRVEIERTRRMTHDSSIVPGSVSPALLLEDLVRDIRFALRAMRQAPLFTLLVVMTLALGIGANTTVFTVINTLLLNPVPVSEPSRLAAVAITRTTGATPSAAPLPLSYVNLKDYQSRNEVFDALAGYTSVRNITWQDGSSSQGLFAELATANYFSTLGLSPAKGRFFLPEEDTSPGTHPVAVMSYGTWQIRFGGAQDIVGRTLRLNNIPFTVIGVAPRNFIGLNAIFGPDVWIPASMAESLLPNMMEHSLSDRARAAFQAVGRLKPGVTPRLAQANLSTLASALAAEYPEANEGQTASVRTLREALYAGTSGGVSGIVFAGTGLLIVVAIVLLIACSNVANLLLSRSAARQQEMAVRLAMGANRARLVRQLLTESVLLGGLSGVFGLGIGYAGLRILFGALPAAANFVTPKLDLTVFVFALAISLATGFLFGTLPALRIVRTDVAGTLKDEARTTGRSRRKVTLGGALLVGQVAFSFLLLVTAALFLRSIGRAYEMDPGFQTTHLAVFMTNPGQAGYNRQQSMAYFREARERVARLPGVRSVSWASNLPLWARVSSGIEVEGYQQQSRASRITAVLNTIDLDYFQTAGVTLESGREFQSSDQAASTPVAIINARMARDYWPNGQALGKRLLLPGEKQTRQVVGIARTASYTAWGEPPQDCVYVPLEQNYTDAMTLYVRSKEDPRQVLQPVQLELRTAAPQVFINSVRTGQEIVDGGLFQARMGVRLLSVFGLLALGLASIGLYGIMAYSVNLRKREIGLRMALGAARLSVLQLVLKEGMSLVLAGVGIGLVASLLVGRLLSRMLYGIHAGDLPSLAGAAVVLLAIAFLACYLPARRASLVDPLVALREG